MRGITVKLPEATLQRLKREAQETGRSVAALVREHLDTPVDSRDLSVHGLTSDLAGILAGSRNTATNERRRFRRP